jgi:hypothetical protein
MESLLRPWRSIHDGNPRFESSNFPVATHLEFIGVRGPTPQECNLALETGHLSVLVSKARRNISATLHWRLDT